MLRHERSLGRRLVRLSITAAKVRLATCVLDTLSRNLEATEDHSWVASLLGPESESSIAAVRSPLANLTGEQVVIPCKACHERSTCLALPYIGCECGTVSRGQESSSGDVCPDCGREDCGQVVELQLHFYSLTAMHLCYRHFAGHSNLKGKEQEYTIRTGPIVESGQIAYVVSVLYLPHLDPLVQGIVEELGL